MNATLAPPRRAIAIAAGAGVLGLAALAAGAAFDLHRALYSYVFGFTFWFTTSIGALFSVLIFHATGARWAAPLRRLNALLAMPAVLTALFAVPLLVFLPRLYPWAAKGWSAGHGDSVVLFRAFWLQPDFFVLRSVFYAACFVVLPLWMMRLSRRCELAPSAQAERRQRAVASGCLPALLFVATFACFDWLMSLTPGWWSEIYGVYVLTGGFVCAFSMLIVLAVIAFDRGLLPGMDRVYHFHNLGKLLFALVCFWAYIAYDQYLLIWIANEPAEVSWYLARTEAGWRSVFLVLLAVNFLVPFFALLSRPAKINRPFLTAVCAWLVAAHLFDVFWIVIPASGARTPRWTDLAALLGVGGLTVAFTLWRFATTSITDTGAPPPSPALAAAEG